jgi:uncharacterized membrane protein YkvI
VNAKWISAYKAYLLPGFVFQSIVIGGGYGTGRELVEFFLRESPAPGYLGMVVAMLIWGIILALGFELARVGRNYDYRTFSKALLGRAWIAVDVLAILSMILTVAVVGSASGELLHEMSGAAPIIGTLLAVSITVLLVFWGSALIERVFSLWSFLLYGFYLLMIVLVLRTESAEIIRNAAVWDPGAQWLLGGVRYAGYNLAGLSVMLFVVRHIQTRRQAVTAGFLAGAIAMLPGMMIYTALLAYYPSIVDESIPANFVLGQLDWPAFQLLFQIILFGTFIETGTGTIHGFNERLAGAWRERGREMTRWQRLSVGAAVLVTAVWLADHLGFLAVSVAAGVVLRHSRASPRQRITCRRCANRSCRRRLPGRRSGARRRCHSSR